MTKKYIMTTRERIDNLYASWKKIEKEILQVQSECTHESTHIVGWHQRYGVPTEVIHCLNCDFHVSDKQMDVNMT